MEILKPCAAVLSNYEVLKILTDRADMHKRYMAFDPTIKFPENLIAVQSEVTRYLQDSPCGSQIPEQIHGFLTRLAHWKLTKQEKLQILDLRAKSLVDLHLIIEECEERFTQGELEQLLEIVKTTLPRDDEQEMVEQDEDTNDDGVDGSWVGVERQEEMDEFIEG